MNANFRDSQRPTSQAYSTATTQVPAPTIYDVPFWMKQVGRDAVAALIEFLGTCLFLLMGLGGIAAATTSNQAAMTAGGTTSVNTVASIEQLLYISTSMGLALLAAAWVFYRVSGSVFNPNVALALMLTGNLTALRFIFYVIAEIGGAIAASALLSSALPGSLAVSCSLGVGTEPFQGVLIEAFLTMALTLAVLLLAVEKSRATPFAPIGIGLVLFSAHLLGVIYTGAAMNSARAFGPAVISGFDENHWVYWLGPTCGSLSATGIYHFLKTIHYYKLTPRQDFDVFEPPEDLGLPSTAPNALQRPSPCPLTTPRAFRHSRAYSIGDPFELDPEKAETQALRMVPSRPKRRDAVSISMGSDYADTPHARTNNGATAGYESIREEDEDAVLASPMRVVSPRDF